ncbi:MAG TPA: hypothetical protein IAC89_01385 [Candidatus Aphodousia faecalis]|nr:hypothetical protein [Candidatus Aphodousia faecalis]
MSSPMTKIFYFDSDGYFQVVGWAQSDKKGKLLMPPNATTVAPELDEDYFYKWDKDQNTWQAEKKPTDASELVGQIIDHKSQTPHMIELRKIVEALTKDNPRYRDERGTKEQGYHHKVVYIPEPTQDEKDLEAAERQEQELLQKLRDTDYVAIKIAEGAVTEDEQQRYEEIKAQRAEWRDQVNALRVSQGTLTAKIAEANA